MAPQHTPPAAALVAPLRHPSDTRHADRLAALAWADLPPSVHLFRSLARSSRLLWERVHFSGRIGLGRTEPPLRVWVCRKGGVYISDAATGAVLMDDRVCEYDGHAPPRDLTVIHGNQGHPATPPPAHPAHPAQPEAPCIGPLGLVEERASHHSSAHPEPLYQNYRLTAALNPHELADPHPCHGPRVEGVQLSQVQRVLHHGRAAWQAIATPTQAYAPLCPCCALLHHAGVSPDASEAPALSAHPQAHSYTVRLDVETGICVFATPADPPAVAAAGTYPHLDIDIHATDDDVTWPGDDVVA